MSRTTPRIAAIAFLILTVAPAAHAQLTEIQPGARVRVRAPGIVAGRYTGTILSRNGDTLRVGSPNSVPVEVPVSRITMLEVSRGSSRSSGAVRGTLWGGAIGLGAGLVVAVTESNTETGGSSDRSVIVGYATLSGFFYGAIIGAIVGREQWDSYDLPRRVSLRVHPGGVGTAIAFGF